MVLRPVAPFSQSMSPWRATATHFESENIDFVRFYETIMCIYFQNMARRPTRFILC